MAAPFTMDEKAAEAWLTDVVVTHEFTECLGEPLAPTRSLPIGMTWHPGSIGEEGTTSMLVRAARREGIVSGPGHAELAFEYIDDGAGGRYRWLLDLTAPTPLKLSTLSESLSLLGRPEATGVAAALAILREAVEAANLLLHQLSDYIRASTTSPDGEPGADGPGRP